jgi:hypothetical protein
MPKTAATAASAGFKPGAAAARLPALRRAARMAARVFLSYVFLVSIHEAATAQSAGVPACLADGELQLCDARAYVMFKPSSSRVHVKAQVRFTVANSGALPIGVFDPQRTPGSFQFGTLPVIAGSFKVDGMPGCGRSFRDCALDPKFRPLVLRQGEGQLVIASAEADVDEGVLRRSQSSSGGMALAMTLAMVDGEGHLLRVPVGFPTLPLERSYPADMDRANGERAPARGVLRGLFH